MRWALPLALSALTLARQAWLIGAARRRGSTLVHAARAIEAAAPQGQHHRVLLVGDSTGVGVGAHAPAHSLPGLLAREFPQARIVNRCRNGARVADALAQVRALRGRRFDVALILVGGNDVIRLTPHARLAAQAQALLAEAARCARHVVWLGSANIGHAPVLRAPLNWKLSWLTRRTMRLLARTAGERGVTFVDFCRRRGDDPFAARPGTYFAADGLHPSSASYRLCFEVLKLRVPLAQWLSTGRTSMTRVSDIMTSPARSIGPQESLRRAAAMMRDLDVGSLPVCHDSRLLGMVTDRDIATRGVAIGLSPDGGCVSDVMSAAAACCRVGDDVEDVMQRMSERQLRRLPVLDDDHRLVGIVALADVALAAPASTAAPEAVGATVRSISEPSA